ncbi:LacI family DNA-binding transcriptional regulator [Roseobacter sinensis]|uniref:LacI family DNA-binding transcriptional regulator n=1 Tax=Roseobacter sinensis TaxID=2931391 RepID=A0ABT3BJR5_9RHOB|nr:LacI family DNA-binding transcriptional regulator [Roseobacter sp. WL0113]MCV3273823.1 LacI family DNA-binding transcriptional regulator [Roseobacter sp. WL0113]
MSRSSAPTLEDVARLAGVSTASISRALNDPDKVAKPTRDKIEAAIEALGYTPNFGGRALASNRTNTVGAIIPSMANAMFASGVQAFQEVLSEAGVNLLVASTGYDPDQELRQIKALIAHGADGLMLIGDARPEATRDFLAKRRIPYVISWCLRSDDTRLYVGFDNRGAAYDAMQRVLALGHRRVAMICGVRDGNDRARDRFDGVAAAIADFGQGAELLQVEEATYRIEFGGDAFARIMAAPERPTVVMCGNDVLAAGALKRAREMGIDVPGQVSIVGFDDIGLASVVTPQLATVRVPQIEMGRAAARLLLAKLNGQACSGPVELPTEFMSRASLAPPAP